MKTVNNSSLFSDEQYTSTYINNSDSQYLNENDVISVCYIIPLMVTCKIFVYKNFNKNTGHTVEKMDLIEIPFGKQVIQGVCVNTDNIKVRRFKDVIGIDIKKIKNVSEILCKSVFSADTWLFLQEFSRYNIMQIGQVVDISLPTSLTTRRNKLLMCGFILNDNYKNYFSNHNRDITDVKKLKIKSEKTNTKSDTRLKWLTKPSRKKVEILIEEMVKSKTGYISGSNILLRNFTTVNLLEKLIQKNVIKKTFNACDSNNETKPIKDQKLNNVINEDSKSKDKNTHSCTDGHKPQLSEEQKSGLEKIKQKLNGFNPFFLHGVTGSGKTEVYICAIKEVLNRNANGQILVLLPEIAMSSLMIVRLKERFGVNLVLWHSSATSTQKQESVRDVINGKASIIVGVRSAILMPYKNLSLIIVDEEHDSSYKQEEAPTYNARDMAVLRAKIHNIPIILGSATPSVETYKNGIAGKYTVIKMEKRFFKTQMPQVHLQDVKRCKVFNKILTKESINKIKEKLSKDEQVMIFVNRRGYSRMMECSSCKFIYECPNCDNKLVYHLKSNNLICHYCQHKINKLENCIYCNKKLEPCYLGAIGIERVEKELKELLPNVNIVTMSSDTMASQESAAEVMDKILNNKAKIILSTQIGSKGYNFKNLNLVIAIGVDIDHIEGDVRIFEKTHQLLTQVCGRAGRFGTRGEMIIQTRNTNNPVLMSIISSNPNDFYKQELARRQQAFLPPYCRQISLTIASSNEVKSRSHSLEVYRLLVDLISSDSNAANGNVNFVGVNIFGPIPNTIYKLKKQYRYNILLQHKSGTILNKLINCNIEKIRTTDKNLFVKIDVDPYNIF
ncbi:MAG: primosomal protein N' [Alphaproteobacteria bacterium]|nr:primosomal protein N' [Rickettsiales bacterium]